VNFWTGIVVGCFLGANIGIAITAILVASKRSDSDSILQAKEYPIDEAVVDDTIQAKVTQYSPDRQYSDIAQFHLEGSKAINSDKPTRAFG
jgi:hypothetical protein